MRIRNLQDIITISIHSPHTGRDYQEVTDEDLPFYFNPLSPHGERHPYHTDGKTCWVFQSTLPAWGETNLITM